MDDSEADLRFLEAEFEVNLNVECKDSAKSFEPIELDNVYNGAKALQSKEPETCVRELRRLIERGSNLSLSDESSSTQWQMRAYKRIIKIYIGSMKYSDAILTFNNFCSFLQKFPRTLEEETMLLKLLNLCKQSVLCTLNSRTECIMRDFKSLEAIFKNNHLYTIKIEVFFSLAFAQFSKILRKWASVEKYTCKCLSLCEEHGKYSESDFYIKSILIEIYSLRLDFFMEKRMLTKFRQTLSIASNIDYVSGCTGYVANIHKNAAQYHILCKDYERAKEKYFAAFQCYNNLGCEKRYEMLQFYLLTHALCDVSIDPFQAREIAEFKICSPLKYVHNILLFFKENNLAEFCCVFNDYQTEQQPSPFMHLLNEALRSRIIFNRISDAIRKWKEKNALYAQKKHKSLSFSEIRSTATPITDSELKSAISRGILSKNDSYAGVYLDECNSCIIFNQTYDTEAVKNTIKFAELCSTMDEALSRMAGAGIADVSKVS